MDFPQYWSHEVTKLSTQNFIVLVPGYGHGMAKFRESMTLIRTQFWHCLMKLKNLFGVAPVIWVSSFPTPVNCIPINVFSYLLSEYHDPY